MIYQFVVQLFGPAKKERPDRELPPPPCEVYAVDEFGQAVLAFHQSLNPKERKLVNQLLPLVLRLGSRSRCPKDWRPFWRAAACSPDDTKLRLIIRTWLSLAKPYAVSQADGRWAFVAPSHANLAAVRGMFWLYEEVFA